MNAKTFTATGELRPTQNEMMKRTNPRVQGFKVKTNIKAGPTCTSCRS